MNLDWTLTEIFQTSQEGEVEESTPSALVEKKNKTWRENLVNLAKFLWEYVEAFTEIEKKTRQAFNMKS